MYNTIIFDLDGTLLNTLDDLSNAVNYCLEKYGYPKRSRLEIRSFIGNGIYMLLKRALPKDIKEEELNEIFKNFKKYYTDHCRINTKPYDGIIELLTYLKNNKYKMAIVSNKNDAAVKELVSYYFKDFIEAAIGAKEDVRKKPAPDTVNEAMELLKVNKENVIYVGDSEVDKQTADNAGIKCILVDWGFRDRQDLVKLKPLKVVSSAEELRYIIKENLL